MKAIGIILAGGNNKMMKELSNKRAIAAIAAIAIPAIIRPYSTMP